MDATAAESVVTNDMRRAKHPHTTVPTKRVRSVRMLSPLQPPHAPRYNDAGVFVWGVSGVALLRALAPSREDALAVRRTSVSLVRPFPIPRRKEAGP